MKAALLDKAVNTHVSFTDMLKRHHTWPLTRAALSELQINVGRLCNQACNHCHVDAGPKRLEIMTWDTMEKILAWSENAGITKVDITGGAPEMNPHFKQFVESFIKLGARITSRCNLSILLEPGYETLVDWYACHGIRLVCSLPCYTKDNVDSQRGKGVFEKSISALKLLNGAGYGLTDKLVLDLVYNPGNALLPPDQDKLEREYRCRLGDEFGISFSNLLTITNLPINRFRHFLEITGQLESYQTLLENNFNANTVPGLMCRHIISIDWRGFVYDCDFNQMIDLPLSAHTPVKLWELAAEDLSGKNVGTGNHCYGCTAGAGSSCGGSLA